MKVGRTSAKVEVSFKIDKGTPGEPTIALTGTVGENGYYVSEVDIAISAGEAGSSGVRGIKYKIEGATNVAETEVTGSEATLRLTKDGESIITAYVISNSGSVSSEISQTIKKDAEAPTAEMTVASIDTETVTVNANIGDNLSGVASYVFEYKRKTDAEYVVAPNGDNPSVANTFTYTGLEAGTEYNFRITVKDSAGNTGTSVEISQATEIQRYLLTPSITLTRR